MNYKEAIEYINDKNKFGSRLGLKSIKKLLDLLGNPEEDLKYIHIGGTNGKGSTSSFISSILMEAGYNVGIFTSPYIERFNERIQINKVDISNEDLARLTLEIKEKCNIMVKQGLEHPTTFEIITGLAFMYFKEKDVDFVVLEVGLGGRYDSTNIIKNNIAAVITHINIDHTNVLGNTLEEIAYQKAGIIKNNSNVISYPQDIQVEKVLKKETEKLSGKLSLLENKNIKIKNIDDKGSVFSYIDENFKIEDLKINLIGKYQVYNASLAIKTIKILKDENIIKIRDGEIRRGLEKTKWAGRLELLKDKPRFLIDGAHNVDAAKVLNEAIDLFEYDRLILGLGILADKEYDSIVKILVEKADIVIATEVNMPRKLNMEVLKSEIEKYKPVVYGEKNIKDAIDKSLELGNERDLIVFAGSLYLVGEIRKIIKQL